MEAGRGTVRAAYFAVGMVWRVAGERVARCRRRGWKEGTWTGAAAAEPPRDGERGGVQFSGFQGLSSELSFFFFMWSINSHRIGGGTGNSNTTSRNAITGNYRRLTHLQFLVFNNFLGKKTDPPFHARIPTAPTREGSAAHRCRVVLQIPTVDVPAPSPSLVRSWLPELEAHS